MGDERRQTGELAGQDHPGKPKELPRWQPWQPPPAAAQAAQAVAAQAAVPAARPAPGMAGDAHTREAPGTNTVRQMDFGALDFAAMGAAAGPEPAAAVARPDRVGRVLDVAGALGELGVVGTLAQVAAAYTRTTFDPARIGESIGAFIDNLEKVSQQVAALPGVGEALLGLGGVGAIVSGARGFREAMLAARGAEDAGARLDAELGAAVGAAKVVGGVATALSPFVPPLAAVAGVITFAGVALDLGRMALGHRAPADAGAATGTSAGAPTRVHAAAPPSGTTGGWRAALSAHSGRLREAMDQSARIISNNSSAMTRSPFAWLGAS